MTKTKSKEEKLLIAANTIVQEDPILRDDVRYAARCLVACSLPYRKPKPEQLKNGHWVRQNGEYKLWVQGGENGIPYGKYPRLFLIWLVSELIMSQDKKVSAGSSYREFCRKLGVDTSMSTVERNGVREPRGSGALLMRQMDMLIESRFNFTYEVESEFRKSRKSIAISDDHSLFWARKSPDQANLFEAEIEVTDGFFEECVKHSVPLDMAAVDALMASPMAMDIYQFLAYRLHRVNGSTKISYEQLYNQFGSENALRQFKQQFKNNLKDVLKVYPSARVLPVDDGIQLYNSAPPVSKYIKVGK